MKKIFSSAAALVLCSSLYGQNISVTSGWHLKGATEDISNMAVFSSDCVSTVWTYDNGWKAFSADASTLTTLESSLGASNIAGSISSGSGFWIYGSGTCTIDTNAEVSNVSISSNLKKRYININNYHLYLDDGIYFELETGNNWFMAMGSYSGTDNSIVLNETDGSSSTITYSSLSAGSTLQFSGESSSETISKTFENFEKNGPFSTATYDGGDISSSEKFAMSSCTSVATTANLGEQLLTGIYFCHSNGDLYLSNSDKSTKYGIAKLIGNKQYFVLDLYKYDPSNEDEGAFQVFTRTHGATDSSAYYTYLPFTE